MSQIESFRVLGVNVHAVQIPHVIEVMKEWIDERKQCHFIAVTGMHGITEAQSNEQVKIALNAAHLVVADGMPLVWLGRRKGFALRRRVYGPELMMEFCNVTSRYGVRHYFYGGAPGVAETLSLNFQRQFPGMQIAGTHCPPFRDLSPEENKSILNVIEAAQPDVLWVGLSTPKQELWMFEQVSHLRVPVMVGVGAAFDFHTGRVKQAPAWMRENGLEWLFRLSQEPMRLWKRYLIGGPKFIFYVGMEMLGLR